MSRKILSIGLSLLKLILQLPYISFNILIHFVSNLKEPMAFSLFSFKPSEIKFSF